MDSQASEQMYRERIARVVAAIVRDPAADHRLDKLAALAHFSRFHFHRVYRSITGETVAATVRRVRLAQATRLLGRGRPSVTEIGLDAGYESPQAFSRAFHQFAGHSPQAFRSQMRATAAAPVQVESLAAIEVLALQHRGPFATIPHTHRQLRRSLGERVPSAWLGLVWGEPDLEGLGGEFRYCVAAAGVDAQAEAAELEAISIPAGWYAVHTLAGPYTQIAATFDALYAAWLPRSGYEPDDRPALERYRNSPLTAAPDALLTDLMIPVRPLEGFGGVRA